MAIDSSQNVIYIFGIPFPFPKITTKIINFLYQNINTFHQIITHKASLYTQSFDSHRFHSFIKQHVCPRARNAILASCMHRAIIELIPFLFVLGVCGVMTTTEPAIMVADRVELVHGFGAVVVFDFE